MEEIAKTAAEEAARVTKFELIDRFVRNYMRQHNCSAEEAMEGLGLDPEERDLIRDSV